MEPKRRRTEEEPYLHLRGVCDFCDSRRDRDRELLLGGDRPSPPPPSPAGTEIDSDMEATADLLGMDEAKFPITPEAKRARSGDNTPEKERPAGREIDHVPSALPKDQQALGQLMALLNTKVDNYAMQMFDRQKESDHHIQKLEGEMNRQHQSNVQPFHALEKQNKELRDTIGRVQEEVKTHQQNMKQLQSDFNKKKEDIYRRADQMHDSLQTARKDWDRVDKAETSKSVNPIGVADRPGIVFGGFSGCVLAEKSSQWLREVLERYQIDMTELTSRARRPKALVLRFASRGEMWKVWHKLKRATQDLRDPSHELFRSDIPAPWITLDQSVEERERTRPISQATRCCRSAAESLGYSSNGKFDIEARYKVSEETVKCTFDEWRSEILLFCREGDQFVLREGCTDQIPQDLYKAIAKEWELARVGSSRSS